jgi:hypothetical protein
MKIQKILDNLYNVLNKISLPLVLETTGIEILYTEAKKSLKWKKLEKLPVMFITIDFGTPFGDLPLSGIILILDKNYHQNNEINGCIKQQFFSTDLKGYGKYDRKDIVNAVDMLLDGLGIEEVNISTAINRIKNDDKKYNICIETESKEHFLNNLLVRGIELPDHNKFDIIEEISSDGNQVDLYFYDFVNEKASYKFCGAKVNSTKVEKGFKVPEDTDSVVTLPYSRELIKTLNNEDNDDGSGYDA